MCNAPMRIAPAASSRAIAVEVLGAIQPSRSFEPQPAGLPLM